MYSFVFLLDKLNRTPDPLIAIRWLSKIDYMMLQIKT